VAEAAGSLATAALLTGMGADGSQGLLKMRQAGAHTIAQDEATSIVFGMPREAIRIGGAEKVLPLGRIAPALLGSLTEPLQ
jgi:two-component system chemotaxis response regulator CheB